MGECVNCIDYVNGYCIDHNVSVDEQDGCEHFIDRTTADFLCEFMCGCEEENNECI